MYTHALSPRMSQYTQFSIYPFPISLHSFQFLLRNIQACIHVIQQQQQSNEKKELKVMLLLLMLLLLRLERYMPKYSRMNKKNPRSFCHTAIIAF